jgi:hypothetical protein
VTAIGTLYDTVVTPQPAANHVPGGRSIQIQEVCPGRRFAGELDHIHMAGDNVAYELAVDALDHPGPADPSRIAPASCALDLFPGADPVKLATLGPALLASFQGEGSSEPVDREPALRCPLADRCGTDRASVPATAARLRRTRVRRGGRFAVVVRAERAGRVRLRFTRRVRGRTVVHGSSPSVAAAAGTNVVRVAARGCRRIRGRWACRTLRPGRYLATIQTRTAPAERWQRLARIAVSVARR